MTDAAPIVPENVAPPAGSTTDEHTGSKRKQKKNKWKCRKAHLDAKARPNKKIKVEGTRGDWEPIPKENEHFESYYKALGIMSEDEWDTFMSHMRLDLPATFRVVDSKGDSDFLNNFMVNNHFSKLKGLTIDGQPCAQPERIPWYPNGLAWQVDMSRPMLRKSEELFSLHQFLVSEVERGSIARQEAVSMIPPLVLDVKSHHTVLDMCAAPGSKTLQLLEALHADTPHPSGLLIANDGDNKRCYMLVTQTKRFNSLAFMITNEDATRFPNVKVFNDSGRLVSMKYDRILCDVPCTGDGTLRKNYAIWKKWEQAKAIGIHKLQRRILLRAMDMMAEGGKIVYSTCSLNPIENEATVLSALKDRTDFELLPTDQLLPGLKRRPGLISWKVMSSDKTWYDTFEDITNPKHIKSIAPTMFCEGAKEHNLQYCMRVYPHQQNTGGFFICVMQKKNLVVPFVSVESNAPEVDMPIPEDKSDVKSETLHNDTNILVDNLKWKTYHGYREDPYFFQNSNSDCFEVIREWYKLSDSFPYENIFARSKSEDSSKQRNLSVACSRIKDIIQHNERKIKIINCGLRVFSYCKESFSSCPYRLLQEGAHFTSKFMGDKLFKVSFADMAKILSPEGIQKISLEPELFAKVKDLPMGIVVFYLPTSGGILDMYVCVYITENGVRSYITEDEKNHYRMILGLEPLLTKRELKKLDALEKYRKKKAENIEGVTREEEHSDVTESNGSDLERSKVVS